MEIIEEARAEEEARAKEAEGGVPEPEEQGDNEGVVEGGTGTGMGQNEALSGPLTDLLTEEMTQEIISGKGAKYKKLLGKRFHLWIDACAGRGPKVAIRAAKIASEVYLNGKPDEDFERCEEAIKVARITEEDAAKFHEKADKPPKTDKHIKEKLPSQHWKHIDVFRPKKATVIPPHRSYDLKIELKPGEQVPYSKSRPFNPDELSVIKKWIDDNSRSDSSAHPSQRPPPRSCS